MPWDCTSCGQTGNTDFYCSGTVDGTPCVEEAPEEFRRGLAFIKSLGDARVTHAPHHESSAFETDLDNSDPQEISKRIWDSINSDPLPPNQAQSAAQSVSASTAPSADPFADPFADVALNEWPAPPAQSASTNSDPLPPNQAQSA